MLHTVRPAYWRAALLLLAAALVAAGIAPLAAQDTARPPAPPSLSLSRPLRFDSAVTRGVLPNGLRYYIRANREPRQRAELRLVVNAGSILEDEDQRGVAHVVEHIAFRGTKSFPGQAITGYLESVGMRFGADLNARTSFDETVYQLTLPTDSAGVLQRGFQIMAEWASAVSFDSTQIERERPVVVEEWRLGLGAASRIRDRQLPVMFAGSRYATRLPIGDRNVLDSYSAATLRRFYEAWYRPDLMAVIAVGDFDARSVERMIRSRFGGLQNPARERPRPVFSVPPNDTTLIAVATDREAPISGATVLYKRPADPHVTVGAFRDLVVGLLYNSMLNERLYELSRTADPPFLGASSADGPLVRSVEAYTLSAAVKDNGVDRGLRAVLGEANRVERLGFAASELDRAKRDLLRGLEQSMAEREKTASRAYAEQYVTAFTTGNPDVSVTDEYALAQALLPGITLTDVNRLAGERITRDNRVILATAPDKPGVTAPTPAALLADAAAAAAAPVVAYTDSGANVPLVDRPPPAAGHVVGERTVPEVSVTEWTLSNGVRVLLKPTDFRADQILLRAYAPGGSSLVPDSLATRAAGASFIVSTGGAGKLSAVNLQKALAGRAVELSALIADTEQGFSGSASPRDAESLLQLVYLYFTQPRADTAAFNALRASLRSVVANESSSPDAAFRDSVTSALTRAAPRARDLTAAQLDSVDIGASLAAYRARFADASGFTFVFVGNVDPATFRPRVERWLGALPSAGKRETWRDLGIRPPAGVLDRVVRKGSEPRSRAEIAFTGPFEYTRQNIFMLGALRDVLDLKLRERVRDQLGGSYGVQISARSGRIPAPLYSVTIDFTAAPDRLEALVNTVFAEIDSLRRADVAPLYVQRVKEADRRQRETSLRSNGFWLRALSSYDQAGWPLSDILDYDAMVQQLDPAMVRAAAVRYLRPDRYVRVSLFPALSPVRAK